MSLMYSTANDKPITRNQLEMIPTPKPLGPWHNPYGFGQYMDDIEHALGTHGMEIAGEEYAVTKDKQRMFGVVEVAAKSGELITANDWKVLMGVRGSHDQRIPRELVFGTQVMVCSNLQFGGNIAHVKTKQTTNIGLRLPTMIRDAVEQLPYMAQRQERVFEAYKNTEVKPRWGDAALVEIYRRNGLTSQQLGVAVDEWHEPSHGEHAEQAWSGWRLLNACTEAVKPTGTRVNHNHVAERTKVASEFIDHICGIDF